MAPRRNRLTVGAEHIKQWGLAAIDRTHETVALAGEMLAENVIVGGPYSPGTPVRSGAARGSWDGTGPGEAPKTFDKNHTDKSGLTTLARVKAKLRKILGQDRQKARLATDCKYMRKLDEGSSTQAPNGHVRIALAHWADMLRDAARIVNRRGLRAR